MDDLQSPDPDFVRDDSGATAIEYALIAAMVAITAIAGLTAFGNASSEMWQSLSTALGGSL